MVEAIVTLVTQEAQDTLVYPVTKIYRIQFDTEQGFGRWMAQLAKDDYHVAHSEQLKA
jgi:hypothetical protein